jgi:hypothetical protein
MELRVKFTGVEAGFAWSEATARLVRRRRIRIDEGAREEARMLRCMGTSQKIL